MGKVTKGILQPDDPIFSEGVTMSTHKRIGKSAKPNTPEKSPPKDMGETYLREVLGVPEEEISQLREEALQEWHQRNQTQEESKPTGRKLITLVSTEGKTREQIVDEVMRDFKKYQDAKKKE